MEQRVFRPWRIVSFVLLGMAAIVALLLWFGPRNVRGGMPSVLKALFFDTELWDLEGWIISPSRGGLEGLDRAFHLLVARLFLIAAAGAMAGLIGSIPKPNTRRVKAGLCLGAAIVLVQITSLFGARIDWGILLLAIYNSPLLVQMALGMVCLRNAARNKET